MIQNVADGPVPNGASAAANAPGIAQAVPGSQDSGHGGDDGSDHGSAGAVSAIGSAGAAPNVQPTMQQLMAMMVQQSQALLNMQQMQMQNTPQSVPGVNMQSPLSRAVDLRGMLKCEEFTGGKETFPDWKRTLYSTVDLVNPQWAVKAKQIEKNLDQEVKLASMTTEERAEAGGFYTFLVHLCKNVDHHGLVHDD